MLKLIEFLLCITLASSACSLQQTIINEGKKLCCYYDSKKIPTIGVGFNLRNKNAIALMSKYNLVLSNVLEDCQKNTNKSCLTSSQADEIFNKISYPEAASCADRYVANLPATKRAAIIDVAFAGCGTLNEFVLMKAALQKQDWKQAGIELRTSPWCMQVKKNRCDADYNCIVEGHFQMFSVF
jgi:GH24 family phage-related lysozyme (muramidase)